MLALSIILSLWEWTSRGQAIAIIFFAHPMACTPPEVERKLNNVQFVLDAAGSMAEKHGAQAKGWHHRFDAARSAIEQCTTYRKGDATGGGVFNAVTEDALHAVFKSIDEIERSSCY